ncbi:unnamed protein product [Parnassius apollo]|uniref:(apollo) hypothetical protein n=1 Tax=Parnassius apollo TaxID=110799 RepID=A0A8S3Y503_PARAO|nr:unnamed protein product [Parnassius apollo]
MGLYCVCGCTDPSDNLTNDICLVFTSVYSYIYLMKLEESVVVRDWESKEVAGADVVGADERRQRLSVIAASSATRTGDEGALLLSEAGVSLTSWPLHTVRLLADLPDGTLSVEAGGEILTWRCCEDVARRAVVRALGGVGGSAVAEGEALGGAALGALLDDAAADEPDAEQWVRRLAERLARLDALNVAGMLAAATEGGGQRLAERLEAGGAAGAALTGRLVRYEACVRGGGGGGAASGAGGGSVPARGEAARADAAARALLQHLQRLYSWLDAPQLQHLDSLSEVSTFLM